MSTTIFKINEKNNALNNVIGRVQPQNSLEVLDSRVILANGELKE